MPSHDIDDYVDKQRKQKQQFKECFGTVSGEAVLKALKEEFYDVKPGDRYEFEAGQRDVIFTILELLEKV